VDYWITTTYPRERTYRKWWLHEHQDLPFLMAYESLANKFPRGLAHLDPLAEERSGKVMEALAQ
jgi:hypothetical protein